MPTNQNEAKQIFGIVNDYIGLRVARELTKRLVSEVGSETDNSSLRESLQMLYDLYHSNANAVVMERGDRDCSALHHDD